MNKDLLFILFFVILIAFAINTNATSQEYVTTSMFFWLDKNPPVVVLNTPADHVEQYNGSFTFNCSFSDPTSDVYNVSLYTNFTGAWIANITDVVSGSDGSVQWNRNFTTNGTFKWNCKATDVLNNAAFASANRTFSVGVAGYNFTGALCPTIYNPFLFEPTNMTHKNVSVTNQSNDNCVFNLTRTGARVSSILKARINATYTGLTLKIGLGCNLSTVSQVVFLNTSYFIIDSNFSISETVYPCMWMDYDNPSEEEFGELSFNISSG